MVSELFSFYLQKPKLKRSKNIVKTPWKMLKSIVYFLGKKPFSFDRADYKSC